ncbi:hypothetical protein ACFQ5J_07390 [Lacticaseibacillus baoqingensis]|uniref:Uncharacterized protein n=1 Tax=Lacticaseibacillus baoqingensis TaxID=2486013 RepID=A0ABW4E8K0_9LACO|nr:hypothetical protein [Lacticaseibacillus baoqingensis]
MLDQSTVQPVVWLDDHFYITIIPNAPYNLEVWQHDPDAQDQRLGRMDYKFHRDTFAGFIYRLLPKIDLLQIHAIQKQLNPFFDLEV